MQYAVSVLIGLLLGALSIFFSFGGIADRKLFLRLLRKKGKWRLTWCMTVGVSVLYCIYSCWLFGGICRDFFTVVLLLSYLAAMSVTDIRGKYLPDDAAIFFGVLFFLFRSSELELASVADAGLGGGVGLILLGLPHLLRPDDVGLGDVKLLAVCGLMTGFPGIVYLLVRGLVLMAIFSIVQMLRRKAKLKTQVPMVPFLLIGAII